MPHALAPYALAKFAMALYFTPPPYHILSCLGCSPPMTLLSCARSRESVAVMSLPSFLSSDCAYYCTCVYFCA